MFLRFVTLIFILSMLGFVPLAEASPAAKAQIVGAFGVLRPTIPISPITARLPPNAASGAVLDGRDIGTVVFPQAELKLFLIADLEVRVERRWLELKNKGIDISHEEVKANLLLRDHIDSTREDSPLKQASDATVIDTSYLTPKEQLQMAVDLARSIIGVREDV